MNELYWAGSDSNCKTYTEAIKLASAMEDKWVAEASLEDEPKFPPIYELVGDVGVVKVEGSLIPGEAGFMRYFGVTGYGDIKQALVQGISDKRAKSLMLYVNSAGGAVSGVEDAGLFIEKIAKIKPLSVYSEFCASAAYWLASSAGHITTGSTSINGSIGVIRIHTEYTKQMESEGVTKNVIRSGKYKALGNMYEVLSDEAKVQIKVKLDYMYKVFIGHVAANRGTTEMIVDSVMGQGLEFIGQYAVDAGLVDKIGTFEEALAYSRSNTLARYVKPVQNVAPSIVNAGLVGDNVLVNISTGNKMHLTTEQLAALASVGTGVTGADDGADTGKTDVSVKAEVEVLPQESEAIAVLKTELVSTLRDLATAKSECDTSKAKVSALEGDVQMLSAVVKDYVNGMNISVGRKQDVSGMSSMELVAAHSEVTELFKGKFKSGGVARSSVVVSDAPEVKQVPLISSRDAAAIIGFFK